MLSNYLRQGIGTFIGLAPVSAIILALVTIIKFLFRRKFEFKPLKLLSEFAWILTVMSILVITGVVGGDYNTTSLFDGNARISFDLFKEGLSIADMLNLILFIPFGFFSPIVFSKLKNKRIYGILIGVIVSVVIEFLQTFTGRFAELDDILMNTLGTFLGYEVCLLLSKRKNRENNDK